MKKEILGSLRFFLIMTLLCGGFYTFGVTGIAQLFFPYQANGSMLKEDNKVTGSALIGQEFTEARYIHGRPTEVSQLSPYSPQLKEKIEKRTTAIKEENNGAKEVPADLVMGSGSGVDPHISFEGAIYQAKRIADSRNVEIKQINDIIETNKETDRLTGNEYINVLVVNAALDQLT